MKKLIKLIASLLKPFSNKKSHKVNNTIVNKMPKDLTSNIEPDSDRIDQYKIKEEAESYFKKGNSLCCYQQDYAEAITYYSKAIEIDPNNVEVFTARADAKYCLRNYSGSIADYTLAISVNDRYEDSYYNRGTAKVKIHDVNGAIADYTKTIEINPLHEKAFYNRATLYNKLENYSDAISDFSKCIEINPLSAEAYFYRGLANIDNEEDALSDFNSAIDINPNYSEAYYYRSQIKINFLGEMESGNMDLKKASQLGYKIFD